MTLERARVSEWMDRASSGDREAFSSVAAAVQDELYRFALGHGLTRADAPDAVQESLLRAFRGLGGWKKGADAPAWLYGIAMNVVREFRRRRARDDALGLDPDALGDRKTASASQTEDGADDLAALAGAVQRLPPRQREVVTCRFLLEMNVRDTAAAMGCEEGTVKAATFAALGNLRETLKDGQ
jgi:RNA polymerase sigma-70 factor (ECF subfamily)